MIQLHFNQLNPCLARAKHSLHPTASYPKLTAEGYAGPYDEEMIYGKIFRILPAGRDLFPFAFSAPPTLPWASVISTL
jgi:hypothetical protein